MEHLSVDEIIDFVSLEKLNDDAVKISTTVNEHIRNCEKCLKLVRAFQMIYDEFSKLNASGDFKKYIKEKVSDEKIKNEEAVKTKTDYDDLDGFR